MQRRPFPDRSTEETQNPQAVGAPLEQRVAEALNDNAAGITSAAIAALYNEVAAAITAATAAVATAKINALDPTVVDPAAARARRDDCAFQLERLKAALAPLQARYAQLRQAERRAQWRVDYARIEAERDAAATSLKNIYGEFTTKLIDALLAAKAIDEDIARINSTAPNGEPDRVADHGMLRPGRRCRSECCVVVAHRIEAAAIFRPWLAVAAANPAHRCPPDRAGRDVFASRCELARGVAAARCPPPAGSRADGGLLSRPTTST
jgi:hypothetical protein